MRWHAGRQYGDDADQKPSKSCNALDVPFLLFWQVIQASEFVTDTKSKSLVPFSKVKYSNYEIYTPPTRLKSAYAKKYLSRSCISWGESEVLQYFGDVRHNSVAGDESHWTLKCWTPMIFSKYFSPDLSL